MNELERLKSLLFTPERREIEELREHVSDPGQRTQDLATILPEAIRAGHRQGDRLAAALEEPVGSCIRSAVERDTRVFADAISPLMGPAIRRAVAQTLRSFIQSINHAIEYSFSIKGLSWRIEAWRTGVPFAGVVLKHLLVYRVDAAYLIHHHTGLLVGQAVADTHTTLKDEDAMSAVLTAIQDFMDEAFAGVGEGRLETIEVGGRSLWVIRGARASLACLISGVPPLSLRHRLDEILNEIEAVYAGELTPYSGDRDTLGGLESHLATALALEYREPEREGRIVWWPWLLALLALVAWLGYAGWQHGQREMQLADLRARLDEEPGIHVVDWRRREGRTRAVLLRDPLAADPARIVQTAGLAAAVNTLVVDYQSLEPTLVAERARRLLGVPPGVSLTLDGSTLRISGVAAADWVSRVRNTLILPPGVAALYTDRLEIDRNAVATAVVAALDPPPGVTIDVAGERVTLAGRASWSWIRTVPQRLRSVPEIRRCTLDALDIDEWLEAQRLARELEAASVFFVEETRLNEASRVVIDRAAEIIPRLTALDAILPMVPRIELIGQSDGVGSEPWNKRLRLQRAHFVRRALAERGVDDERIVIDADPTFAPSSVSVPALRRVDWVVSLQPPQPPVCGH